MSWISNLIEQIKHTTYVCFLATPSDAPAALEKTRWKKHCLEKARWKKHREVAGAFKGYIDRTSSTKSVTKGLMAKPSEAHHDFTGESCATACVR